MLRQHLCSIGPASFCPPCGPSGFIQSEDSTVIEGSAISFLDSLRVLHKSAHPSDGRILMTTQAYFQLHEVVFWDLAISAKRSS